MERVKDILGDAVSLDRLAKSLFFLILPDLVCQHIVIFAFHDCLIAGLSLLAFTPEDIVAPLQDITVRILQKLVHIVGDEGCWGSTGNQLDDGNQEQPIFEQDATNFVLRLRGKPQYNILVHEPFEILM